MIAGVGAKELRRDPQAIAQRLMLPSSTWATPSARAISGIVVALPLNENDDVRAETSRSGALARRFRISSAMPSAQILLILLLAHVGERQHRNGLLGDLARW